MVEKLIFVLNFICFTEKPWPVTLGAGIGLGMGYSNCQHDFNSSAYIHGRIKKARFLIIHITLPLVHHSILSLYNI